MAQCPKCGGSLRLFQWRPECPHCGVNMIYYASNDRLLKETEQAEIEHAKSQPRIDRLKAATIGSPKAIARLVLSVLPIGALFLPLAFLQSGKATVNALSIYEYVSEKGIGPVFSEALAGRAPGLPYALLLICALVLLLHLFFLTASLGKRGKLRTVCFCVCILLSGVGAVFGFTVNQNESGMALGWGSFVFLFLICALIVYEGILLKTGMPVKHTICYIGGLPSDEYFAMVEAGVSELEIRKKMVEALTRMRDEVFRKAAEDQAAFEKERAARK